MRVRLLLTFLLGLLVALPIAAPAAADDPPRTPAERARQIATALAKDPVYVDPAYASAFAPEVVGQIRTAAAGTGYPVYTVILPLTPGDQFRGEERTVIALVMDALRKPGLYVVLDGGSRFPWTEVRDLTVPTDDTVQAARRRALDETDHQGTPAQVLVRMYTALADPSLPSATDDRRSGRGGGADGVGWLIGAVVVGVLVTAGVPLARRQRRRPRTGLTPSRPRPFTIPDHVAESVAQERLRRLRRETADELVALGEQLAALPAGEGAAVDHQQRALDAHQAAAKALDGSDDVVDVVGAGVLLGRARAEYDTARALADGRRSARPVQPCAFNPLHGDASGSPASVEVGGTELTLPLCADCRRALRKGRAPASLRGADGPYWHGDDVWARTFFGAIGDDLATSVNRGDLSRD